MTCRDWDLFSSFAMGLGLALGGQGEGGYSRALFVATNAPNLNALAL